MEKEILDLCIGLDIGTSTTKVVIHPLFADDSFFVVDFEKDKTEDATYLLPTKLAINLETKQFELPLYKIEQEIYIDRISSVYRIEQEIPNFFERLASKFSNVTIKKKIHQQKIFNNLKVNFMNNEENKPLQAPKGEKKLIFEAPWDFDSAMGNKDRCADSKGLYAANIVPDVNGNYETINPWLAVRMYEDWYTDIIRENWTEVYDSGALTDICNMIKSDTEEYSEAFTRNYKRWNNIIKNDSFVAELSKKAKKCRTHSEASEYLYDWLTKRIEYLNEHWHN